MKKFFIVFLFLVISFFVGCGEPQLNGVNFSQVSFYSDSFLGGFGQEVESQITKHGGTFNPKQDGYKISGEMSWTHYDLIVKVQVFDNQERLVVEKFEVTASERMKYLKGNWWIDRNRMEMVCAESVAYVVAIKLKEVKKK